ncbi:unnamed protein product [Sphacelaria rigidula]
MLTNRGIKWRYSPPRTPRSNGVAKRAIQQMMRIERSQLVEEGRGEDYWFSAKILDIVGELKAVKFSDDEDKPSEEEEAAPIDGDDGPGGQPPQDPHHRSALLRVVDCAGPVD